MWIDHNPIHYHIKHLYWPHNQGPAAKTPCFVATGSWARSQIRGTDWWTDLRILEGFHSRHSHGGSPIAGWFFFHGKPQSKWMMTGGTSMTKRTPPLADIMNMTLRDMGSSITIPMDASSKKIYGIQVSSCRPPQSGAPTSSFPAAEMSGSSPRSTFVCRTYGQHTKTTSTQKGLTWSNPIWPWINTYSL